MMQKLLTLFCLVLMSPVYGQQNFISSFTAQQTQYSVTLSFTVAKGSTCNGIDIQRSADSINFETIGDIQGVCGSTTEETFYQFTDSNPVSNKRNFYRLVIPLIGNSQIISIRFSDFSEQPFFLYPNPCKENLTFKFENFSGKEFELLIFDASGKIILSEQTKLAFFFLQTGKMPAGNYFFQLTNEGEIKQRGRFIIL